MNHLKKYGWIYVIILSLIIAIVLRIILPWNIVFTPNGVVFQGVDAYYYAHIADMISQNNLQIPKFDAYYDFPNGMDYSQLPTYFNAYGFFIALITWIVSWGHPTKQILDVVAGLHPAVLGILALIPIFFITRKITKNNWVASGAMLLGAVIPGEYMGRAMLGSADTHCLEIFLFSFAMMFTVLALDNKKWNIWPIVLAGIFACFYLIIWQGAVIYPLLVALFGVLWLIWTRTKGKADYENACIIGAILTITATLYIAFTGKQVNTPAVLASTILVIVALIYTISLKRVKNWIYLLPIGVVALVGAGIVISIQFVGFTFYPQWLTDGARQVWNLVGWHTQSTTAEELPLLITLGSVTTEIPMAYFSSAWYVTFIGIGMLIYKFVKGKDINIALLLIWTLIILIPTLAMRRFAYYFAINVIIVTAITLWYFIKYTWARTEVKNVH